MSSDEHSERSNSQFLAPTSVQSVVSPPKPGLPRLIAVIAIGLVCCMAIAAAVWLAVGGMPGSLAPTSAPASSSEEPGDDPGASPDDSQAVMPSVALAEGWELVLERGERCYAYSMNVQGTSFCLTGPNVPLEDTPRAFGEAVMKDIEGDFTTPPGETVFPPLKDTVVGGYSALNTAAIYDDVMYEIWFIFREPTDDTPLLEWSIYATMDVFGVNSPLVWVDVEKMVESFRLVP